MTVSIPVFALRLVRERTVRYDHALSRPNRAAEAIRALIGDASKEHLVVLFLDAKAQPTGAHVAAIGSLTRMAISIAEILRPALVANALAFVIGHCHPSGDCTPSPEDEAFTQKLVEAAELVGLRLMDHVIVAPGSRRYFSFLEAGRLGQGRP